MIIEGKICHKFLNISDCLVNYIQHTLCAVRKLRHENISEFKIAEARLHDEINILWIPGKTNPADIFTKEDKDVGHYEGLRDHMVKPREDVYNI